MANGRDDIRVAIGLPRHVKTKKLIRLAGYEGFYRLVTLWTYAAENHIDGVLPSEDEIELLVEWAGEPGKLVAALKEAGFLESDGRTLHDWVEEQPYVVKRPDRVEAARVAGQASAEARRAKHGTAQPNGRWTESERCVERNPNESFGESEQSVERSPNGVRTVSEPPSRPFPSLPTETTLPSPPAPAPKPLRSQKEPTDHERLVETLASELNAALRCRMIDKCRIEIDALIVVHRHSAEMIRKEIGDRARHPKRPWDWSKEVLGYSQSHRPDPPRGPAPPEPFHYDGPTSTANPEDIRAAMDRALKATAPKSNGTGAA